MAIEYIKDHNPEYILNKHTTYENTVLQEHAAIIAGLKDTTTTTALIEAQGRMFVGICMKEHSTQYIEDHFHAYYNEEYNKLDPRTVNVPDRNNIAFNRAWIRIINEAMTMFIKRYKVDGSKAKIAVLDYETFDGRAIVEAELAKELEVSFTEDEHGL